MPVKQMIAAEPAWDKSPFVTDYGLIRGMRATHYKIGDELLMTDSNRLYRVVDIMDYGRAIVVQSCGSAHQA